MKNFLDFCIVLLGSLLGCGSLMMSGIIFYEIFWPDDPDLFTLFADIIIFSFFMLIILIFCISLKANHLYKEDKKDE